MNKTKLLSSVLFGMIVILGAMAAMRVPVDFWLTADQQGDQLMSDERFSEAAEMFDDPKKRGVALYRDGQFEDAAAAFARVDDAESAFNRGVALVMQGKYDAAIESFDRALQFEPNWKQAQENRQLAIARRDNMKPPDDDAGGTGGMLEADEIVFDNRPNKSSETQEIEAGKGEALSDQSLRELWLQRVQTKPQDFMRAKFAYQAARDSQPEPAEVNE